jgi:peptide alpha-N-acetyltransferase
VPDNVEVMSLKAIFFYYNDQPNEGLELAKSVYIWLKLIKAVNKNLSSEFAWHILGLINKANKNYHQSVICFKQATKKDTENLQLLRDLANL